MKFPESLKGNPDCERQSRGYHEPEMVKEMIKAGILCGLFFVAAPAFGFFIRRRLKWQRVAFFALCFMTTQGILAAGEWGLTLGPILYRGHARGFHFYFIEAVALSLVFARAFGDWRNFRCLPPGLWLYFLYCALSLVSIINAPLPNLALMSALKAVKVTVIFVAAYNYFRNEDDLKYFVWCMAMTMFWQCLVALKMKYLDGIYQVLGTFEHQNALGMFTCMIGMVFLAVGLGPKIPHGNMYLFAYLACGVIVQSTFSRAGLAMFAAGSLLVILLSLVERPSKRRWYGLAVITVVGVIGIAMTIDTIAARFKEYGTEQSKITRDLLNEAARRMVRDYPLGIGWNNFGHTINHPYRYGDVIDEWDMKHGLKIDKTYRKGVVESLYYLLLSETGYQGLLSFLILIALFLWWNTRAALTFRNHFLGCLALGLAVGCFINYVQSTLERVLTQPRNMMLWMLLLAAGSKLESWRRLEKKRRLALARQPTEARRQPPQPVPMT